MIKVKDYPDYSRDPETGAIIMTNNAQYKKYIEARNKTIEKNKKFEEHDKDISNIKEDISDIKNMLKMLLENRN